MMNLEQGENSVFVDPESQALQIWWCELVTCLARGGERGKMRDGYEYGGLTNDEVRLAWRPLAAVNRGC